MIVIHGVSMMIVAKQEMLAVGDSAGTLHILDVPWALKNPSTNEVYIIIILPSHSVSLHCNGVVLATGVGAVLLALLLGFESLRVEEPPYESQYKSCTMMKT